jgi:predicted RNA binding protein YcfA (HicA-like mRNA interferase family)
MPKRPRLRGREIIAILRRSGFEIIRIKGSHHYLRHVDGRSTVVPVHAGEVIGVGLLGKILKDVEWSDEDLIRRKWTRR